MAEGKGHAVKGGAVAALVGAGSVIGATYLGGKVPLLSSSHVALPAVLALLGIVLIAKGKPTAGVALAAAGGAIYGVTKAGTLTGGGGASGLRDLNPRADAGMRIQYPLQAGALGMGGSSPGEAGMLQDAAMLQD